MHYEEVFLFLVFISTCLQSVYSQITTNELPFSIQRGLNLLSNKKAKRVVELPVPDIKKALHEDSLYREKKPDGFLRTAIPIPVNIDMETDGIWTSLDDGSKIWQTEIRAEKALAIDFVFSKFWLPKGGKFFIFNPSTKETIGAITSQYLAGEKKNPHRFSTAIVKGDHVILEYFQPAGEKELPVVVTEKVYYSYRNFRENVCSSEVNVNCSEGNNWQFEKDAVALVHCKWDTGSGYCSGFLVNNTMNNLTPYFITADHCLGEGVGKKDAITDNDLSDWVFYWGYEQPTCSDSIQWGSGVVPWQG